jgi:hypothetical protein
MTGRQSAILFPSQHFYFIQRCLMQLTGYGLAGIIFLVGMVVTIITTIRKKHLLKLEMIMKKFFFAMLALMASVSVFAQVDSTNMAVDSTSTSTDSTMVTPGDSTSQSTMPSDTTAAGSSTDSTSVATDTTSVGSADDTITDEDLRKYAVVMDSVESMKQALLSKISTKIKSNGAMKISRYNQLSKAIDDEAKLKELKATQEEIAFVKEVGTMKQEGAAEISNTVEKMANEFVGSAKYNKIKGSLDIDTSMRTRYDKIVSEMQSDDSASAKTSH